MGAKQPSNDERPESARLSRSAMVAEMTGAGRLRTGCYRTIKRKKRTSKACEQARSRIATLASECSRGLSVVCRAAFKNLDECIVAVARPFYQPVESDDLEH